MTIYISISYCRNKFKISHLRLCSLCEPASESCFLLMKKTWHIRSGCKNSRDWLDRFSSRLNMKRTKSTQNFSRVATQWTFKWWRKPAFWAIFFGHRGDKTVVLFNVWIMKTAEQGRGSGFCCFQGCRSGSVSGSALIRGAGSGPDPHSNCGSGSRRAKMTHKKRKSTEFSCFEVLDVLFWGLKASSVAWASFMEA
jgi:hypothetical protein